MNYHRVMCAHKELENDQHHKAPLVSPPNFFFFLKCVFKFVFLVHLCVLCLVIFLLSAGHHV